MAVRKDLGSVIVQKRGLIRLGDARTVLGVGDGDTLHMWIEDGRIILEPVDLIPRAERYLQASEWSQGLHDALEDIRAGRVKTHESVEALIGDLHRDDADSLHPCLSPCLSHVGPEPAELG